MILYISLLIFNCCCAWPVFTTGVCKSSLGCFFLLAKKIRKQSLGDGGKGHMWLSRTKGFVCMHKFACQHCVHTRRQNTAKQHSFYFQNLVLTHQCKILLSKNNYSCKHHEPNQSVSDKLFTVSLFTQLYFCGCAPISILKVSPNTEAYL